MGGGVVLGEAADELSQHQADGHGAEALPTDAALVVTDVCQRNHQGADEGERTGDEETLVDRLQGVGLARLGLHEEDADDRADHTDGTSGQREHEAEDPLGRIVREDRLERSDTEDDRGDEGDLVALEQVGRHTGAVADVVAHVVGDGRRVAGVVFGDASFDLAHQVGAHVGRLGEDAAADTQEQRKQRSTKAEADEDDRAGVLEHHDDQRCAEQAEADGEHAGHAAGAERHVECLGHAVGERCSGGADVAAGGQRHADVAGEARSQAAEDERQRSVQANLTEAQCGGTVRFGDRLRCHEDDDRQRNEDDGDRLELTLQVRPSSDLDRRGDLFHLGRAFVLGHDRLRKEEAHADGDKCCSDRHEQYCPFTALECELLVAAFGYKTCWHR